MTATKDVRYHTVHRDKHAVTDIIGLRPHRFHRLVSHVRHRLHQTHSLFSSASSVAHLLAARAGRHHRAWQVAYEYSLPISLVGAVLMMGLYYALDSGHTLSTTASAPSSVLGLLATFFFLHLCLVAVSIRGLVEEVKALYVRPLMVFGVYLSIVVTYSVLYFALFNYSRDTFKLQGYDPAGAGKSSDGGDGGAVTDSNVTNKPIDVFIACLYFSVTCMTSTGFGDNIPARSISQFCADSQMAVALMFHIGVFSLAIAQFQRFQKLKSPLIDGGEIELDEAVDVIETHLNSANEITGDENAAVTHSLASLERVTPTVPVASRPRTRRGSVASMSGEVPGPWHQAMIVTDVTTTMSPLTLFLSRYQWFRVILHSPLYDRVSRFIIRHLLFEACVVVILSTLLIAALPDPLAPLSTLHGADYRNKILVLTLVAVLQLVQLIVVINSSYRLVNAVHRKSVSFHFFAHSYFSLSLLFASIYLLMFSATESHEFSIVKHDAMTIIETQWVFVYFSLTTLSGTGFGDIFPRGSVSRCVVSLEMILSIIYGSVILALGLDSLIKREDEAAVVQFKAECAQLTAQHTMSEISAECNERGEGEEDEGTTSEQHGDLSESVPDVVTAEAVVVMAPSE